MAEQNCLSFIKELNFDKLTLFKDTMLNNIEAIVDSWASSPRLTIILNEIDLTTNEFKIFFAYYVFDYFYEYTDGTIPYMTCPVARKFLNNFRKNKNSIRMITLICTEFKNKLTKVIFSSSLSIDEKNKVTSELKKNTMVMIFIIQMRFLWRFEGVHLLTHLGRTSVIYWWNIT